ncbi:nucleosome assembly protein [Gonapodya prolifera JEL478]|uniref:Nucleosome assembly protein n=1 Tax=Gonapodya prolifera (strain JEL478) TaxID=1344416 RepID=A0A139ARV1_GONPJ|nr:nucleosome assembly protein [Gonapodya prolifera JEL478]|eukprot:KXS19205.1 nucleosome assembly protein [Gonapodya prolifera JEL478]
MATPAQILAQNPALFQSLIGRDSGYVQSLPGEVKRRINALKNLQKSHAELEGKFREEVLALEKKYQVLYRPLYDQRRDFIVGDAEPTEEQATFRDPDEEEGANEPTPQVQRTGNEAPVRGIPEFWLTALKNMPQINEMITERDEAALKHLTDIRVSFLDDNPGFKLEFEFEENDFFTDRVLTKIYFLQNDPDSPYDDLLYDHAEGCTIHWKEGMDLSVKIETKKQRHKATNKVRIVKKTVPAETFFTFFTPPKAPEAKENAENEEDEDENEDEDLDAKLEEDYEIGEMLKEKIIPHAIDWFTGKALEYDEDIYDDDDDDEDEDGDDDDGDDDDDE